MKNILLPILVVTVLLLPGCGIKKQTQQYWTLYSNETQGFAIPHLADWYVKEFTIPAGFPFAAIGFDPEPIMHSTPINGSNNGKIMVQVYDAPYMQKIINENRTKPGYIGVVKEFGDALGIQISFETDKPSFQFMTVVEKNNKTFVIASEELTDQEDVKIYQKMVEGFSLD